MKLIACIEDPQVIRQILAHLKHREPGVGERFPESRALPLWPQTVCDETGLGR